MTDATDDRDAPYDGYEVARALGVEAYVHFEGDDGAAFLLEDGRVMKICGAHEAALCHALLSGQEEGASHPGVPRIHEIARFVRFADLSELGVAEPRPYDVFAVIRDGFDDLDLEEEWGGDETRLWRRALGHLAWGWAHQERMHVDHAIELWRPHGTEIDEVVSALEHVLATTGRRVGDLRTPNLGRSPDGVVGVRDLGRHDGASLDHGPILALPALELRPRSIPSDAPMQPSP